MRAVVVGLFFPERKALSHIGAWTAMVLLALAAMGVAGQTKPSTQTLAPSTVQETPAPDASLPVEDTQALNNTADEVEIQRRFNDLRRELLDDRAETINWWLTVALVVLAVISIGAALGGYVGLRGLREIRDEAKKSAEEVRKSAEEIKELNKQAKEDAQQIGQERERITKANILADDSDKAQQDEETLQNSPQRHGASPLDQAVTEALALQRAGKTDEAIEKWRSIANVAERSDPDLAARAWLSVGSLLYEKEVKDAGEQ